MRRYNAQDGQQGGCADVLWAGEGEATTCGDDGSRNDGGMVARHRGPGRPFWPLLASRRHCVGGKTPIENLLRQISPRGVTKKLTQPFLLQWATRGGVVVARVASMHAV